MVTQLAKNNLKGSIILVTAAIIWGLAFVAQSSAADTIPTFTISFLRSYIASAFLLLFVLIKDRKTKTPLFPTEKSERKKLFLGGLICGTALCIAANLQQFGIAIYPSGVANEARAGFLTALYVILVPVASIFFKKKLSITTWLAVVVAFVGIYILCLSDGFHSIYFGDVLLFTCGIAFTVHIITVDNFGKGLDGVKLSILQFFVCGTISLIFMLIFELDEISIKTLADAALPILYLGIMSSGVAYTLQIIGQKYAEAAVASIAMSLESVFAALGGWLIGGNSLEKHEILGCTIMFVAIILAQLSDLKIRIKK
ncbi:MAG: DMT family transporter [Ruminococcaceae bacterium]|nr:DMT family transporter [Oscillospiraceae bacterium]